jgi:hypothetical protein
MVVANSVTNEIEIFRDYNQGIFMSRVRYSTGFGSQPQYVTVADFNKDSQIDIAVANNEGDNINVFLGLGNETFDTPNIYPTGSGSAPSSIAVGDFNKDGWTDMAVTNQNTDNIGIFLGFDYATFINQTIFIYGVLPTPYHVAVGDFNNDSHWDLVVANSAINNISIHLGYGNGTFAKQISFQTGQSSDPVFVTVGDFNNDNQSDIVVANYNTNDISIFLGYGNGSFDNPKLPEFNEIYYPVSIAVGDFNDDNCLDIAVANKYADKISILIGHGNGSFDMPKSHWLTQGSTPVYVIVEDLNNDHMLDIAVANYDGDNIGILLGNGNGTFADTNILATETNSGPYAIATGDFNNDNYTDITVVNQKSKNIGVFFGYGNGSFSSQKKISTGSQSYLTSILVGKLNSDAFLDIAVSDWGTDNANIGILYGFGDGNFTLIKIYQTDFNSEPTSIAIGDFNTDDLVDLAVCNSNEHTITIMLRDKSEPFAVQTNFFTGNNSRPRSVTIGYFNNDDLLDIAVANSGTDNVGIFLGYGNGSFAPQEIYPVNKNSNPHSIATGDFDNDGKADIVVVNILANNFNIYFGYVNGTFTSLSTYMTGLGSNPSAIAVADLNKDKNLDIIIANFGINNVLVFVGFGNGSFLEPKVYLMGYEARPQSVAVGDFNNDNLMDIAVANYGADFTEILEQTC